MLCAYVLAGLPGVGKSTWITNNIKTDVFIYSTDNYIEEKAKHTGKTYNDLFENTIDEATKYMNVAVQKAISDKKTIIWDQTNLRSKKRNKIINMFPKEYNTICVWFVSPETEDELKDHADRLNSRPGKIIPLQIISNMRSSIELPSESFDVIVYVPYTKGK